MGIVHGCDIYVFAFAFAIRLYAYVWRKQMGLKVVAIGEILEMIHSIDNFFYYYCLCAPRKCPATPLSFPTLPFCLVIQIQTALII